MPKKRPRTHQLPELATFPGRLKYARERLNMTKKRLSELTEIDAPRLTRLEQGERINGIGFVTMARLARALDVSMEWLGLDKGEIGPLTFRDAGDRRKTLPLVRNTDSERKSDPAPTAAAKSRQRAKPNRTKRRL